MKNKNIKININRPDLNKDEINKMQDFGSVLNGLNKITKPFYKTPRFYAITSVCVLVIIIGFFYLKTPNQTQIIAQEQSAPFINPAIPNIQVSFASYEIESGVADTIVTGSGTRIIIPEVPFLNQKGIAIKGKVNIKYREFRDPIDMALSGIPMNYDSGGINYQFESAGMCEILGTQGTEPIFVNPENPVTIEMNAVRSDPKYNLYYLDTISKNWTIIDKPIIKKEEVKNLEEANEQFLDEGAMLNNSASNKINKEIAFLKKQRPIAPKKADVGLPHFKLNFNSEDFPELDAYKGAVFEVSEADRERSVKLFAINWDNISYETIESGKKYRVKMDLYDKKVRRSKNNFTIVRTESMIIHPVFEELEYENALLIFKEKDKEYKQKLKQKEDDKKAAIANLLETEKRRNKQITQIEKAIETIATQINYSNIMNVFYAARFGIYNCDHPYTEINATKNTLTFIDEENKPIMVDVLYHLDYTTNTCIPLFYGNCCENKFTYLANNNLLLFTVFPDGKIGSYSSENCQLLKPGIDNKIRLTMSKKSFSTIEEVKQFLGVTNNQEN